jgi:hypothetical protein
MHNGLIRLGFTPHTDFMLQDDSDGNGVYISSWTSSDAQPSASAIATAEAEWQADYDSQEYARKRQAEYPTIEELVVALYDTDDKAAIEKRRSDVKAKYPKP